MAKELHLKEPVIFITGKGGTGKTWISISLAYALAKRGEEILLCDLGIKEHISVLLNIKKSGYSIKKTKYGFSIIHIDPDQSLDEYIRLKLRTPILYIPLTASTIYKRFTRATPGLKDITVIGKIWYEYNQKDGDRRKFDHIIVDMPSTGHAIPTLKLPDVYVSSIPFGPIHSESKKLRDMLKNDSSLIIVTIPEEMAIQESIDLVEKVRSQLSMRIAGILLNMFSDEFSIEEINEMMEKVDSKMLDIIRYINFKREKSENALKILNSTFPEIPVIKIPIIKFSERKEFFVKIGSKLEEVIS